MDYNILVLGLKTNLRIIVAILCTKHTLVFGQQCHQLPEMVLPLQLTVLLPQVDGQVALQIVITTLWFVIGKAWPDLK